MVSEARLVVPDESYHESFLAALHEFQEAGEDLEVRMPEVAEPAAFHDWLEHLRWAGLVGAAPSVRDRTPHRIYWWVEAGRFLGRARLNLRLTPELTEFGGHIGYDIRPTARGRGHATALLRAVLDTAREAGLDRALLTCAPDNHASKRVIERNGGVLADISQAGRLRYWCPTS
ncbi:N-acetyltransferase GCN5 [Amycolatopsis vancoresmycina DSM 44592]|uniref:N-acetyltransferase GCN5 n=1 Tax=Amycolatopsis vancoresmycina DSM 44592 TaxID=1292037 RepID=R1GCP2_9PSEU|nr:N-acetyltransferase GCN5 [Amycolatopsis vancoresmycina DSM 44592]